MDKKFIDKSFETVLVVFFFYPIRTDPPIGSVFQTAFKKVLLLTSQQRFIFYGSFYRSHAGYELISNRKGKGNFPECRFLGVTP